jgi:DNA-binding IclR family transcriptional regulator
MVILTLSASAAPLTLGKLCDLTGTTPATLSRILPELVAAKIVNGKRIGLLIHYSLAPSPSTPAVGVEEEL